MQVVNNQCPKQICAVNLLFTCTHMQYIQILLFETRETPSDTTLSDNFAGVELSNWLCLETTLLSVSLTFWLKSDFVVTTTWLLGLRSKSGGLVTRLMDELSASLSWLKAELKFLEVVLLVLPELVTGRSDDWPEVSNRNTFSYKSHHTDCSFTINSVSSWSSPKKHEQCSA